MVAPALVFAKDAGRHVRRAGLIAQLPTRLGPTVAPAGSFDNELGLPQTVLKADHDTRFLVLEMGARGVGHLTYLCGIAPPRVGVMVNVGVAHIGEFGSVDAIAQAKGELVEALPANGLAVLNADDGAVAVAGWGGDSVQVTDQEAAVALLGEYMTPGDVVLVKGSSYRTWVVADAVREAGQSEVVAP